MSNAPGTNFDQFFSRPPKTDGRGRIENLACRQVLRLRAIAPGAVAKAAGLATAAEPLSFRNLRETVGFASSPAVTDAPVESPEILMAKFDQSKLWEAWVAVWDERPEIYQSDRVLVAEGAGWGRVAVHTDVKAALDERSGLVLRVGRLRLVLEPMKAWAESVWQGSDPTSR